jgi:hypothetical protein
VLQTNAHMRKQMSECGAGRGSAASAEQLSELEVCLSAPDQLRSSPRTASAAWSPQLLASAAMHRQATCHGVQSHSGWEHLRVHSTTALHAAHRRCGTRTGALAHLAHWRPDMPAAAGVVVCRWRWRSSARRRCTICATTRTSRPPCCSWPRGRAVSRRVHRSTRRRATVLTKTPTAPTATCRTRCSLRAPPPSPCRTALPVRSALALLATAPLLGMRQLPCSADPCPLHGPAACRSAVLHGIFRPSHAAAQHHWCIDMHGLCRA